MLPPSNPPDICPLCNGTTWKPTSIDGVERVSRCDCWRNAITQKNLAAANIPPLYRGCDFDTFQPHTNSLIEALGASRRFSEDFPVVQKGLLFVGPHGVGKTHLAASILKSVIQKTGARGVFWEVPKLLRKIRDTYNPVVRTTEIEVIQPVMDAELLVLDELGAEKTSEWVDETMTLIINTRYSERRPTIFTTNYQDLPLDSKELADSLLERVGSRIHSRLHEMCDFIPMTDVDRRILGHEPTAEEVGKFARQNRGVGPTTPTPRGRPAKAQLKRGMGDADLKWSGGRAGSK